MFFYTPKILFIKPSTSWTNKRGMVLFLVLSIALIMGLMMPVYFSFSQQVSFSSFAQLNQDRLASLTNLAHTSILTYFRDQAREGNTNNKLCKFISKSLTYTTMQTESGWENQMELSDIIKLAIPESEVGSTELFKYKITTRVMDQVLQMENGKPYYKGDINKEGLGTFEVILDASLYKSQKLLTSCRHTRRYSFRNVCIVAANEDQYSMGFPLKYAIFARDAIKESTNLLAIRTYNENDKRIELHGDGSKDDGNIFLNNLGPPPPPNGGQIGKLLSKKGNHVGKAYGTPQKFFTFESEKGWKVCDKYKFRPFRTCSLMAIKFKNVYEFNKSGIYNKKSGDLYLPGLVEIKQGKLVLNNPSKITVHGKGGLLIPDGITIKCGIELNDDKQDLCVLYSRKADINIQTSNRIEAAVLCFRDSLRATINATVNVNIYGCIGVDRLFDNTNNPNLKFNITYDKRFKANSAMKEIYSLAILPPIQLDHNQFSKTDYLE